MIHGVLGKTFISTDNLSRKWEDTSRTLLS